MFGSTGTGFARLSSLAPLKGADGIAQGLAAIREKYFHQACVDVRAASPVIARFSGNGGGSKLWVAPGCTRTGFFLLENYGQPWPVQALYAEQNVLPQGWEQLPNVPEKMVEVAGRRLQTVVADYQAAVAKNALMADKDAEFLHLVRTSALTDYGVTLPHAVIEAMGDAIAAIKAEATRQLTEQSLRAAADQATGQAAQDEFLRTYAAMDAPAKQVALHQQLALPTIEPPTPTVVFDTPDNADTGGNERANTGYIRRSNKRARH